jgi:hypothetical protein
MRFDGHRATYFFFRDLLVILPDLYHFSELAPARKRWVQRSVFFRHGEAMFINGGKGVNEQLLPSSIPLSDPRAF